MEKINILFKCTYNTSQEAVEHCQLLSQCIGFSIRIRTSKPNTIYIVCSREGKPDRNKPYRRRNRFSERCQCNWRVVLFNNSHINPNSKWEFRAGKSMNHNHVLISSKDNNYNYLLNRNHLTTLSQLPNNSHLSTINSVSELENIVLSPLAYPIQESSTLDNQDSSNNITDCHNICINKITDSYTLPSLKVFDNICYSTNNNFNSLPIQNFADFESIMRTDKTSDTHKAYPTLKDLLN